MNLSTLKFGILSSICTILAILVFLEIISFFAVYSNVVAKQRGVIHTTPRDFVRPRTCFSSLPA